MTKMGIFKIMEVQEDGMEVQGESVPHSWAWAQKTD